MTDQTPKRVYLWVCPTCGYWRAERSTGVHVQFTGRGPGERHTLVRVAYKLGEAR